MATKVGPLLAAAALLAAASCSNGADAERPDAGDPTTASATGSAGSADPEESEVPLIQPGEPGEPASTLSPGTTLAESGFDHADVAFVQMMIPHHEQALTMAALAEDRASSPQVRSLAERITGQGTEVMAMAGWLQQRNLEVPTAGADPSEFDHGEHGHDTMHGMLTPEQLTTLREADGTRFDELFLTGMIGHHEGALRMISDLAEDGQNVLVAEMAADMQAGQTAEIDLMRTMLDD